MKKIVFILALLWLLCLCAPAALAAQDELSDAAAQTGEQLFSLLDGETKQQLEAFGLTDFSADRVFDVSWRSIRAFFADSLRQSLQKQGRTFASSLALLLLLVCLKMLPGKSDGSDPLDLPALCAVTVLTAAGLHTYVSASAAVLKTSAVFMQGFIPVYAALLAFSGHPGAALSYQTLCFALAQGISLFAAAWCVPLLGLFFSLAISFSLNETVDTPAFLRGVNKVSSVALGLVSGAFSGVLSFRRVIAGAADSAAGKSARFLLSALVPVVGSAVSDAYSAVVGSIDLIKGSALVFAFLVLLVLHVPVLLQLLLARVGCGVLASLAQMLGEKRLSVLYQSFACGVRLLLLLVFFECFLLLITTGLTLQLHR